MTVNANTAHRNAILDAIGAIFNSGSVDIRTGADPGINSADTGTLLVTLTVPNPAFAAASAGSMSKTGTWSGTGAAQGTPGHFRLKNSGATQWRGGTAGTSGTDMILSGLVAGEIVVGATVTCTGYTITQPAA
jgi:hypothetical protein